MKIRAHHLLCIPRYKGGSYTKELSKHWKNICKTIRKNPQKNIKILMKCDEICIKCPHFNEKKNICIKRPGINYWILVQDKKVLKELGIKKDSVYSASDIFNLSINKINKKSLKNICKGCEFLQDCLKLGINKSFEKDLNKNA